MRYVASVCAVFHLNSSRQIRCAQTCALYFLICNDGIGRSSGGVPCRDSTRFPVIHFSIKSSYISVLVGRFMSAESYLVRSCVRGSTDIVACVSARSRAVEVRELCALVVSGTCSTTVPDRGRGVA